MKTFIILVPILSEVNSRDLCETIENTTFTPKTEHGIHAHNVLESVLYELGLETNEYGIEVEPISDFMERVNNEEFSVDDYFISYVNLKDFEKHDMIAEAQKYLSGDTDDEPEEENVGKDICYGCGCVQYYGTMKDITEESFAIYCEKCHPIALGAINEFKRS